MKLSSSVTYTTRFTISLRALFRMRGLKSENTMNGYINAFVLFKEFTDLISFPYIIFLLMYLQH
jgi:hypothetical protein